MIRTTRLIILFSLLMICLSYSSDRVMCLVPDIKINPLDGLLMGEDISTLQKKPSSLNLLNSQGSLHLDAFRGETICFQIVLPYKSTQKFTLNLPTPFKVSVFQLAVVEDENQQYYPDLLIPLKWDTGEEQYSLIDKLPFATGQYQYLVLWVDIFVSGEIDAGLYSGFFATIPEEEKYSFSVDIQVYDLKLTESSVRLDINDYGDKYIQLLQTKDGLEQRLKLDRQAFLLADAHQGSLNLLPYKSQRGYPRPFFAPRQTNADSLNPELDWSDYDKRFGAYFDGSAFPGGKPIHHFYLPFNPDWPAPFQLYLTNRNHYEQIWQAYAKAFLRHFSEKGWNRTIFQVYLNQKAKQNNQIPWNLDEPKSVEAYQALRYYADLTHRVFENTNGIKVLYRMDISHFYCIQHQGNYGKDFRVNNGNQILEPVDIWVVSNHSLQDYLPLMKAKELVKSGKEVWLYGDTPRLSERGTLIPIRIYNLWWNGLSGFLIWKSFNFEFAEKNSKRFILYAVSYNNEVQFWPSLRLKMLRRGIDDCRIFESAIKINAQAKNVVSEWFSNYMNCSTESLVQLRQTFHKTITGM